MFAHEVPARQWSKFVVPKDDVEGEEIRDVKQHELEADKVDSKSGKGGFFKSRKHIEETA